MKQFVVLNPIKILSPKTKKVILETNRVKVTIDDEEVESIKGLTIQYVLRNEKK